MPTVYVTAPREAAETLARALVDERLAACVNRVPCTSTYRWEDEVVTDDEVILFVKTAADRYPALRDRLEELHPYDVPCIERFDEDDVPAPFAQWVDVATTDDTE